MRPSVLGDGRARVALLWVIIVAVGAARASQLSSSQPTNSSVGWLEYLRRQLMQDNYDYLESSSEENSESPSTSNFMFRAYADGSLTSPRYSPPQYAPTGEAGEAGDVEERGLSRKDLLYYVDDAQLAAPAHSVRRHNDASPNVISSNQPVDNITRTEVVKESPARQFQPALNLTGAEVDEQPPQNVTYKLFKLPGGRRGGSGPRFVEESGARGVALVSVDGAPFPQFRLPAPRRQYAPADDDSELD